MAQRRPPCPDAIAELAEALRGAGAVVAPEQVGDARKSYRAIDREIMPRISSSYNALHGLPESAPSPTYESVMQQVHPDDREGFAAAIDRGIAGRVGVTHEYRCILPSGQIKWYRFTATCLYDAKATWRISSARRLTSLRPRHGNSLRYALSRCAKYCVIWLRTGAHRFQ
jgi:hypothetical protein